MICRVSKNFPTVLTFPSRFLEFVTIINIEERYRAHTDDETMLHGGVRAATTMHEFLQGTTGNKDRKLWEAHLTAKGASMIPYGEEGHDRV